MTTIQAHPTIAESTARAWENLPSLYKTLLPALAGLIIVLVPATAFISAGLFNVTTKSLRAQHQAVLTEIESTLNEQFAVPTAYLTGLAASDAVKKCAPTGCVEEAKDLFGTSLSTQLQDPIAYYVEVGFISLEGKETARALRGNGNRIEIPGSVPMFTTDGTKLKNADANQPYLFPMARDARLSLGEAYQAPILRLAMPVLNAGTTLGYVTATIKLDDFFTRNFVYNDQYQLFLLDSQDCLLATSDDARRTEAYRTWSGAPNQTCYTDLGLSDWDVNVQNYQQSVISTRVIHGALTNSDQNWTVVLQEPREIAYSQANSIQALLIGTNLVTLSFVTLLIVAVDRASRQIAESDRMRLLRHARETRFNPYIVNGPLDDPKRFVGRTQALAQIIGLGIMGGNELIIHGKRGIGKTSLLRQVEYRIRTQQIPDPTQRYWPVLVDLQSVPASQFYPTLMTEILRGFPDPESRMDLHFHQYLKDRTVAYQVEDFRLDVNETLSLAESMPTEDQASPKKGKPTRLVLCLDNLPFFEQADYSAEFIAAFRRIFVDAASPIHLIATVSSPPSGDFAANLSLVTLGSMESTEAARLIRQPVADYYTFSDSAINYLIEQSDRLPSVLQKLAHRAVQIALEADSNVIELEQAEQAVQRFISEQEPLYNLIWHGGSDRTGKIYPGLTDTQQQSLLKVATSDGVLRQDMLSVFTQTSLEDISYTNGRGVTHLTTLFKTWLLQTTDNVSSR